MTPTRKKAQQLLATLKDAVKRDEPEWDKRLERFNSHHARARRRPAERPEPAGVAAGEGGEGSAPESRPPPAVEPVAARAEGVVAGGPPAAANAEGAVSLRPQEASVTDASNASIPTVPSSPPALPAGPVPVAEVVAATPPAPTASNSWGPEAAPAAPAPAPAGYTRTPQGERFSRLLRQAGLIRMQVYVKPPEMDRIRQVQTEFAANGHRIPSMNQVVRVALRQLKAGPEAEKIYLDLLRERGEEMAGGGPME